MDEAELADYAEARITVSGLADEDIAISVADLAQLEAVSRPASATRSNGEKVKITAVGPLLDTFLAAYGHQQTDFDHIRFGASDGYAITVEHNLLANRELTLALMDGGSVGATDTPGAAGYGVVKNFQLYGLVENTNARAQATDYVGAVAGKLNAGGTICDVINYADVEAKNTVNVGGIAGFAGSPVGGANDGKYADNPSGYNTFILRCGNEGLMHGYYKLGGIVGENAATVMWCYNSGFILPHMHGSGGGWAGIAGRHGNNNAAAEEGVIAYCYNTGTVTNNGMNDDKNETIKGYGGITGPAYGAHGHCEIYNCYNIGAQSAGRNNYNAITTNLEGQARQGAVHDNYSLDADWLKSYTTDVLEVGAKRTVTEFKTTTYNEGDILTLLGPYYAADTANINSGYPVLYWQAGKALPTPASLTVVTPPDKTEYSATQTFDPKGMVVKATFNDGSNAIVSSDVTYSAEPLAAGATSVELSYTFNGAAVTASQAITVESLSLDGITVTTGPTKTIYEAGQTFDKTGMVITASFNQGAVTRVLEAEEYTVAPDPLTTGLTQVTVSYTYASVSGDPQTLTPDENGVFTIPGADIKASVKVSVAVNNSTASGGNSPTPVPTPTFRDVPASHWAHEFVAEMAVKGFIKGKPVGPELLFGPDDNVTRAEFVTILARMSREALPSGGKASSKFGDIMADAYYAPAVAWAADAGVVMGTGGNAFSPDRPISRQEIATMIYRYATYKRIALSGSAAPASFSDADLIAAYAKDAVSSMQQAGVINGYGDGSFRPLGYTTRAETAKLLCLIWRLDK